MRSAFLLLLTAGASMCSPIVFTFQGTATGTMGTTPFTAASYTVTSTADTSMVSLVDDVYEVAAITSVISIAGLPVATFTDSMYWADPQGAGDIIFGDGVFGPGYFPGILGITVIGQGLETYNLQYSIGPLFSPIDFPSSIFGSFVDVPTSEGSLSLVASDETFTAVLADTPEPASLLLAGLGLTGLFIFARKRRRLFAAS